MPLIEVAIRNAKPHDKAYKLADSGGLYLYVAPTGGRLWRMDYRHGSKYARELEEARVADMREHSAFIEEVKRNYDELLSGYVTQLDKCRTKVETLEAQVAQRERDEPRKDRALGTRERNSLLKLVIGMAVKGYSYDPKAGRTDAVNEIAGDLQLLGLSLSDDTVRKYLIEAKELLSGGETE